jgi:hypothetical protein
MAFGFRAIKRAVRVGHAMKAKKAAKAALVRTIQAKKAAKVAAIHKMAMFR